MDVRKVKPFVKWAGGKTRIIPFLDSNISKKLKDGKINRYIEPFVGSGSLFFHVANNYNVKEFIINDNNFALISAYITIKKDVKLLIKNLEKIEKEFLPLNKENRTKYYYKKRQKFNTLKKSLESHAYNKSFIDLISVFIFLNKTCFNGLFRLNKNGEFNVPIGEYNNPLICDKENLENVNLVLKKTKILNKDFQKLEKYVDSKSFVYIDPPYRVRSNNGFLTYNENIFSWDDQIRLADMVNNFNKNNISIMISNANNIEVIKLYNKFNIQKTKRASLIGGGKDYRSKVEEIIFTNYDIFQSKLNKFES